MIVRPWDGGRPVIKSMVKINGAFVMNVDDVMSDIQSKLDSQSASMSDLLQSSLDSHSDVIRNTLHQHLLVVDSKVAHLRVDGHSSVDASSGIINRSL